VSGPQKQVGTDRGAEEYYPCTYIATLDPSFDHLVDSVRQREREAGAEPRA
jgi:hypothetical protein